MQDEKLIKIYTQFRNNIKEISLQFAPYSLFKINNIDAGDMIYSMFLDEHSRQISNDINLLRRCIVKLQAWKDTIVDLSKQEKFDVIVEFIEPLSITSISLPSVIRDRFTYSLTHLCHQANKCKVDTWEDTLPAEHFIKTKTMDTKCEHWELYTNFKESHSKISDKEYEKNLYNARNMFHHRMPIGIEIGISNMMKRTKEDDSSISYSFGGTEPLSLDIVISNLTQQHNNIIDCLDTYKQLVETQITEFGAYKVKK